MDRISAVVVSDVKLVDPTTQHVWLEIPELRLEAGRVYGLAGTNLSGRSAFLRLLGGGFLPPWEGRQAMRLCVELAAEPWTATLDPCRCSVYLGPNPLDNMSTLSSTSREELDLHTPHWQASATGSDAPWAHLIGAFNLESCLTQNPMELSGGQAAALALICALMMARPVMCVDEVFGHLDVTVRPLAWQCLKQVVARGAVALVSDNQYDLMAEFADEVIHLAAGRVEDVGSARKVFNTQAVLSRKTVPTATLLAKDLWPYCESLPVSYDGILGRLRGTDG